MTFEVHAIIKDKLKLWLLNISFPSSNNLGTQTASQVFIKRSSIVFLTGLCNSYSHWIHRQTEAESIEESCLCQLHGRKSRSKIRHFTFQPKNLQYESLICYISKRCHVKVTKTPVLSEWGMHRRWVASSAREQLSNFQHEAACGFLAGRSQCDCGRTLSLMQSRSFNPGVPAWVSTCWCWRWPWVFYKTGLSKRDITLFLILITFTVKIYV